MAKAATVNPVRGMRDFLPAQLKSRNAVLSLIRSMVAARGFMEIETPAVEHIHMLRSDQGGENESMVFEIMKRGLDRDAPVKPADCVDSGLRYDLTLPLSRYYANNHASLPAETRFFQTGPVWRAERPQKGRFRQFTQCDIDITGSTGPAAEIEVLSTGLAVLEALGLKGRATLHVNDRRLLDLLMERCGIALDTRSRSLIELDKLDKSDFDTVAQSIAAIPGVGAEAAGRLMSAIQSLTGSQVDGATSELSVPAFEEPVPLFDIAFVISQLQELNPGFRCVFDPSLVRGMGYYTGLIYEVKLDGQTSSICGGGRYDGMIGHWLGKDVPAVGFSFGFERIMDILEAPASGGQGMVALGYREQSQHLSALRLLQQLVAQGTPAGLVKVPRKVKSAFFEELASGFDRVIMPENLELPLEDVLASAKQL